MEGDVVDVATNAKSHRIRRTCSVLLIILVAVMAPLVVTSGWAVTTVTNTDRFVSTMSPLGHNPTITNYVAEKGAAAVVADINVQSRIEGRLPAAAAFMAPVIATGFTNFLTKGFKAILQSPRFQHAWDAKLRLLHGTFVKLMTTNPTKLEKASKLAVDYTPEILAAIDKLDANGIHVFDPVRGALTGNQKLLINLAEGKQFHQVQWYFNAAIKLRWILPIVWLILGAAAILLDTRRRRAGLWLSIGVALSCTVMLVLLAIGRNYASSHAPTPPDVANAVFSTLTSFLRWELRIVVVVGALAAFVLWVTGPSSSARSLRRAVGTTGTAAARSDGTQSVLGFVGQHAIAFIWTGVAIACICLVAFVGSLGGALLTVLLTALWIAALVATQRKFAPRTELTAGT